MANTNSPVGLQPWRHAMGGTIRPSGYYMASALASNIYRGSAVKPVGTTKRIDVAAAGDRLIGVFKGVAYVDANGDTQYRPYWASGQTTKGSVDAEATVWDDPLILFRGQVSSATGMVAGDVGAFADLTIGTGSTLTGNSGDQIDQTTITSTVATGGQVRIEELSREAGNAFGQYAKAIVRLNEHYLLGSTTAGQAAMAI